MGRVEKGIVRAVEDGFAEVVMQPPSAEACGSCGSCAEGLEGRLLRVRSVPGAEPGRRVSVEISDEGADLRAALVVFLLPVLAIVAGAVLGALALSSATTGAVVGALAFLLPSVALIRWYDRRRSRAAPTARIVRLED